MISRTLSLLGLLLLLLSAQLTSGVDTVKRIQFKTCPGCRLNHLPEVKRFIKEEVEVGYYPGVTVEYIPGHSPEAVFFDAEDNQMYKLRVDHMSFNDLVEMVTSRGFVRSSTATGSGIVGGTARRLLLA